MKDTFAPLLALLNGSIVPRLHEIQTNQAEQRLQAEQLDHAIRELRSAVTLHFAEIRAELAICQVRIEDLIVTLRESKAGDNSSAADPIRKPILN